MEHFLEYLRNLCEENDGVLQPAYRINGDSEATERELVHQLYTRRRTTSTARWSWR